MKYFVRAVKYFIWFTLLLCLIMGVLVFLGLAKADPGSMFKDGWKSVGQILVLFATVAAFYPRFGFIRKPVEIPGEYSQIRGPIIEYMEKRGYKLESEDGENVQFRLRSKAGALAKMLEDRITFTREAGGFQVEGLTKEVVRIVSALEYQKKD